MLRRARRGLNVADLLIEPAQRIADQLGERALAVRVDVTDEEPSVRV